MFAEDNIKFNKNGRKVSKRAENIVGKGWIDPLAICSFPTVFSKDLYGRHVKTRACLRKERVNQITKF